jgi:hypothetical protein
MLERSRRSPLYVTMMRCAAADIQAGGAVAGLFRDVALAPGSVPALRLLAALHHLVLSGRAPELAAFYPSAAGDRPAGEVWPAALAAANEHREWIRGRLHRGVQTNDPGRSVVLYALLMWLTDRYRLPIRLLEMGASAGLNLLCDRFCYLADGAVLGEAASPVRFQRPWVCPPQIDLVAAAEKLQIVRRCGCDLAPLNPAAGEDRLTLVSYIWPDEAERLARTRAALKLAAEMPYVVVKAPAGSWLRGALAAGERGEGVLSVIWHSLFRQYLTAPEWEELEAIYADCQDLQRAPVVWASMEPAEQATSGVALSIRESPAEAPRMLASCGDHGPPFRWAAGG